MPELTAGETGRLLYVVQYLLHEPFDTEPATVELA